MNQRHTMSLDNSFMKSPLLIQRYGSLWKRFSHTHTHTFLRDSHTRANSWRPHCQKVTLLVKRSHACVTGQFTVSIRACFCVCHYLSLPMRLCLCGWLYVCILGRGLFRFRAPVGFPHSKGYWRDLAAKPAPLYSWWNVLVQCGCVCDNPAFLCACI